MNPYLIISILVIAGLFGLFLLLYFLNKKTPVPKGCEHLRVGEEACGACLNTECGMRAKIDLKKIEEELKEEKE